MLLPFEKVGMKDLTTMNNSLNEKLNLNLNYLN